MPTAAHAASAGIGIAAPSLKASNATQMTTPQRAGETLARGTTPLNWHRRGQHSQNLSGPQVDGPGQAGGDRERGDRHPRPRTNPGPGGEEKGRGQRQRQEEQRRGGPGRQPEERRRGEEQRRRPTPTARRRQRRHHLGPAAGVSPWPKNKFIHSIGSQRAGSDCLQETTAPP